jgi:hypothetical protein
MFARHVADLRIHWSQHGVGIHYDLVGCEGDQGAATHCVMWHKYRQFALMFHEGLGNLLGCKQQAAGRVQNQVDRLILRSKTNGSQDCLRVFNVNRTADRHTEYADGVLPVDHRDHTGLSLLLEAIEDAGTARGQSVWTAGLLDEQEGQQRPEECFHGKSNSVPPRFL